jgi:predicted ribosomally synthesized peptide with SipW-like signal peptide
MRAAGHLDGAVRHEAMESIQVGRRGSVVSKRKKKLAIFGALGLVVIALAIGAVGSAAWFTDQDTVAVSGTAGAINIDLSGDASSPMTLTNVLPGVYDNLKRVNVYNTAGSTVGVKYRLTAAQTGGSAPMWSALHVKVRHGNCVGPPPAEGHNNGQGTVYEGPIADLNGTAAQVDNVTDPAVYPAPPGLGINITACYSFEFKLADDAGNALQSATVNFNIVADATQVQNPGWSESGT